MIKKVPLNYKTVYLNATSQHYILYYYNIVVKQLRSIIMIKEINY